jgi:hypothetical protein
MTVAVGTPLDIRHLGSIHLAEQVHHCVRSSLRDAERVHAGEKAPVRARLDLVKDDVFETQPTNVAHLVVPPWDCYSTNTSRLDWFTDPQQFGRQIVAGGTAASILIA